MHRDIDVSLIYRGIVRNHNANNILENKTLLWGEIHQDMGGVVIDVCLWNRLRIRRGVDIVDACPSLSADSRLSLDLQTVRPSW